MADEKNQYIPQGLSEHTRSVLRRLVVFSLVGLAISYGSAPSLGINSFISSITLETIYIVNFLMAAILYYFVMGMMGFKSDRALLIGNAQKTISGQIGQIINNLETSSNLVIHIKQSLGGTTLGTQTQYHGDQKPIITNHATKLTKAFNQAYQRIENENKTIRFSLQVGIIMVWLEFLMPVSLAAWSGVELYNWQNSAQDDVFINCKSINIPEMTCTVLEKEQ